MNLVSSIRINYEILRSLGFVGIGVGYAGIGTPFINPVRILSVYNTTDVNLLLSLNGIDDHAFISANGGKVTDFGANASNQGGFAELPAGSRWYVKQEAGAATLGHVYIEAIYLSQR
jgi:hypothetical protein